MIRLSRRHALGGRSTRRTSRGRFVIVLAIGLIGLLVPTANALTSSGTARSTYDARAFTYDDFLAPAAVEGAEGFSLGAPTVPALPSVTAPTTGPNNNVAAKTVPGVVGPARSTDMVLDSFRGLGPGKQRTVRTVGSVDEMRSTFDAWSVGAERLPARGAKVPDVYRLPDGGVIQWRTGSGTGGPTIDIFPPSGAARTLHLADGVPW